MSVSTSKSLNQSNNNYPIQNDSDEFEINMEISNGTVAIIKINLNDEFYSQINELCNICKLNEFDRLIFIKKIIEEIEKIINEEETIINHNSNNNTDNDDDINNTDNTDNNNIDNNNDKNNNNNDNNNIDNNNIDNNNNNIKNKNNDFTMSSFSVVEDLENKANQNNNNILINKNNSYINNDNKNNILNINNSNPFAKFQTVLPPNSNPNLYNYNYQTNNNNTNFFSQSNYFKNKPNNKNNINNVFMVSQSQTDRLHLYNNQSSSKEINNNYKNNNYIYKKEYQPSFSKFKINDFNQNKNNKNLSASLNSSQNEIPKLNSSIVLTPNREHRQKATRVADILMKINSNDILYDVITKIYSNNIFNELMSSKVNMNLIQSVEQTIKEATRLEDEEEKKIIKKNKSFNFSKNNNNNKFLNNEYNNNFNNNFYNNNDNDNNNNNDEKMNIYELKSNDEYNNNEDNNIDNENINKNIYNLKNNYIYNNGEKLKKIPRANGNKHIMNDLKKQKNIDKLNNELIKKYPNTSKTILGYDKFRTGDNNFVKSLRKSSSGKNINNSFNNNNKFNNFTNITGGYFDDSLQNGGESKLISYKSNKYFKNCQSPVKDYIQGKQNIFL